MQTEFGSSGSPILNLNTFKVIGIHKEGSNHFNFNKGTFLKFPLNDFIKKIKIKSINILKPNKDIIKDESQNNDINDIENNIIMKEFKEYMSIGYQLNMLNEYIVKVGKRMIKKKDFIPIRKIIYKITSQWFSIDFTNGNSKKNYNVRFMCTTGHVNFLLIDYGTTINEMINNFLFSINRTEIYLISKRVKQVLCIMECGYITIKILQLKNYLNKVYFH